MDKKKVFFIGALHFFVDINAGFFAVYMVIAGLDPMKAALISSISNLAGNGIQPLLGFWTDRIRGKMPIFLSVLIGSIIMSSIGLTKDYSILYVLMIVGTIFLSLFHPAGSNIASAAGLQRKERGFAIFITIGTLGFALSQPYFSGVTSLLGNRLSIVLALPAVVLAFGYLLFSRMEISGPEQRINLKEIRRILQGRKGIILLLFAVMVLRHGFIMTLGFFIAKIFADWGFQRFTYSIVATVYSITGALGMLISGYMAHRIKTKSIILVSLIGYIPFFIILIAAGQAGSLALALPALAITGFILQLSHVPIIVMGHRLLPEGTSTISGVLLGFAWAIGRLVQPIAPACADFFSWAPGISSGLIVLTSFMFAAMLLSLLLPARLDSQGTDSHGRT